MPRIFGLGLPELLIIVVIICVLFGPALFKKINSQVKKTGAAAKQAVDSGAKAAGTEADLSSINKDTILNKVEGLQNHVDKMFESANEESEGANAPAPKDNTEA